MIWKPNISLFSIAQEAVADRHDLKPIRLRHQGQLGSRQPARFCNQHPKTHSNGPLSGAVSKAPTTCKDLRQKLPHSTLIQERITEARCERQSWTSWANLKVSITPRNTISVWMNQTICSMAGCLRSPRGRMQQQARRQDLGCSTKRISKSEIWSARPSESNEQEMPPLPFRRKSHAHHRARESQNLDVRRELPSWSKI